MPRAGGTPGAVGGGGVPQPSVGGLRSGRPAPRNALGRCALACTAAAVANGGQRERQRREQQQAPCGRQGSAAGRLLQGACCIASWPLAFHTACSPRAPGSPACLEPSPLWHSTVRMRAARSLQAPWCMSEMTAVLRIAQGEAAPAITALRAQMETYRQRQHALTQQVRAHVPHRCPPALSSLPHAPLSLYRARMAGNCANAARRYACLASHRHV